MDSDLTESVK